MMERVVGWAFALTLAVLLLFEAGSVFLGPQPNAVFGLIAARSGLAFFEPGMRYVTGVLEVLAVILLILPRTRAAGAGLALAVVLGALAFHLSPWLGISLPQPAALSAALAAHKTSTEIAQMNLPTDHGAMFMLAVAIAVLSVAVLLTERAKLKAAMPKPKRPAGAFA